MDYAFSINQIYSTKVSYNQQKTIIIQSLDKMNLGQEPVELALENFEKNINKFLEKINRWNGFSPPCTVFQILRH